MIVHGFADVTQPGESPHLAQGGGRLRVNLPGSCDAR